jgi:hypothetical protein
LIEYGFPKDIVEKYFKENPIESLEVVVPALAILVTEEEEKIAEKKK